MKKNGFKLAMIRLSLMVVLITQYVGYTSCGGGSGGGANNSKMSPADRKKLSEALARYDDFSRFSEELLGVEKNSKWGFIDKSGKETVPCIFDFAMDFKEGLAAVEKGGKWGYIDKSGKEVVPCIYRIVVREFSEGLSMVSSDDGRWGYVDKTGNEVIPLIYNKAMPFSDGLAWVYIEKWDGFEGYIDKTGEEVMLTKFDYEYAGSFHDGLAVVMKDKMWGYIDKTGKEVIPLIYKSASSFSDGLARIWKEEYNFFIDKTGKEVFSVKYPQMDDFSDGIARVTNREYYGYVDKTGKEVIPLTYSWLSDFSEGLAKARQDGFEGYIDQTGVEVIPFLFKNASDFSDGLARVTFNNETGLIDKNGFFIGKGFVKEISALAEDKMKEDVFESSSKQSGSTEGTAEIKNENTENALLKKKINDIIHFFTHNGLQAKYTYRDTEMMDVLDISTGEFVSTGQTSFDEEIVLIGKCRGYGRQKGIGNFKQITTDWDVKLTIFAHTLREEEWIMPRGFPLGGDIKFKMNYNPDVKFDIIYHITAETGDVPMTVYKTNNVEPDWIVGEWEADIDILNNNAIITFGSDGRFNLGNEDCFAKGKFTIQGNAVHLNGTIECPDNDSEEYEYNKTITIIEKTLEGYNKISSSSVSTSNNSNSMDWLIGKWEVNIPDFGLQRLVLNNDGTYISTSVKFDLITTGTYRVDGNEINFYPKTSNAPNQLRAKNPQPYSKTINKQNRTIEFSAETGDYYRK